MILAEITTLQRIEKESKALVNFYSMNKAFRLVHDKLLNTREIQIGFCCSLDVLKCIENNSFTKYIANSPSLSFLM